jgi:hypothetical protein
MAAAWLLMPSTGCQPGPGPVGNPNTNKLAFSVPADDPFTYGLVIVWNDGPEDAELEEIEMVDPTPGLHLLGAEVGGPDRRFAAFGGDRIYPPRHPRATDVHPLAGFRLPPRTKRDGKRGAQIILQLRASEAGIFRFQGVRLNYRVGDTQYSAVIPHAFRACAVTDHKDNRWPRCLANREYS